MTDTDDKKLEEGQTEAEYGGCEGPNAMYVKLISSDDHEFIINRDYALTSGTIKAMLSGPGKICAVPPKRHSVFRYYGLFSLFLCEMKGIMIIPHYIKVSQQSVLQKKVVIKLTLSLVSQWHTNFLCDRIL